MPAPMRLRVFANPFAALDGDGNPAGAFQEEGAPGVFIGATLVQDAPDPPLSLIIAGEAVASPRRFEFEGGPFDVPTTGHYLYAIRTGELLPADERTAREAGVKFVAPNEALAAAKARAVADFRAHHGVDPACVAPPPPPAKTAEATPPADVTPTHDADDASGEH